MNNAVILGKKDILQETVERRCKGVTVARSKSETEWAFMGRKFPLIALITNPGRFDDRESKIVRWYDQEEQVWKQRYVRGNRSVPVLLYCWAQDEAAADVLFSRILPANPPAVEV